MTSVRSSVATRLFLGATAFLLLRLRPPALLFFFVLLLRLQFAQIVVETIEALLPEAAIVLQPLVHGLERLHLDAAGPPLRLTAARDQSGALQNLQMLGDRRHAHG